MATLADLNNTDAAVQAGKQHLEGVERADTDAALSRSSALATKRRLEAKAETEREQQIVMVPIAGETIPMHPLEAGKDLEIRRMLIEGHRDDDISKLIEAADEQRRLFAERNYFPEVFDREFFNQFEKDEIVAAWSEWTARSRNADEPLGNR